MATKHPLAPYHAAFPRAPETRVVGDEIRTVFEAHVIGANGIEVGTSDIEITLQRNRSEETYSAELAEELTARSEALCLAWAERDDIQGLAEALWQTLPEE